jgi:hypothetical protein
MANTQKPKSEIFERVLEEERRWNVRFFNGARFVAVSLFLVVRLDADQDARGCGDDEAMRLGSVHLEGKYTRHGRTESANVFHPRSVQKWAAQKGNLSIS